MSYKGVNVLDLYFHTPSYWELHPGRIKTDWRTPHMHNTVQPSSVQAAVHCHDSATSSNGS